MPDACGFPLRGRLGVLCANMLARGRSPAKNLKPLGPRVASLAGGLDSKDPVTRMAAISELALLVSCSGAARDAVAAGQVESKLLKVLSRTSDSNGQCYIMSILSNLADNQASRERQVAVVPALATLLKSHSPEVRHAAALHLARLSHRGRTFTTV